MFHILNIEYLKIMKWKRYWNDWLLLKRRNDEVFKIKRLKKKYEFINLSRNSGFLFCTQLLDDQACYIRLAIILWFLIFEFRIIKYSLTLNVWLRLHNYIIGFNYVLQLKDSIIQNDWQIVVKKKQWWFKHFLLYS